MKFRERRGGLADSMDTLVTLPDRAALVAHCQELLRPYEFTFEDSALHVNLYFDRPDRRIDWEQTYIVTIDGYGVMGFTDGAA